MIKDHYSRQPWLFEDSSLVDLLGQSTRGDRAIVDSQPLRVPYSTTMVVFFLDYLFSFLLLHLHRHQLIIITQSPLISR